MTKQRFLPYDIKDLAGANAYIAPLEHKHPTRSKNTHTLLKPIADHWFPISVK